MSRHCLLLWKVRREGLRALGKLRQPFCRGPVQRGDNACSAATTDQQRGRQQLGGRAPRLQLDLSVDVLYCSYPAAYRCTNTALSVSIIRSRSRACVGKYRRERDGMRGVPCVLRGLTWDCLCLREQFAVNEPRSGTPKH